MSYAVVRSSCDHLAYGLLFSNCRDTLLSRSRPDAFATDCLLSLAERPCTWDGAAGSLGDEAYVLRPSLLQLLRSRYCVRSRGAKVGGAKGEDEGEGERGKGKVLVTGTAKERR